MRSKSVKNNNVITLSATKNDGSNADIQADEHDRLLVNTGHLNLNGFSVSSSLNTVFQGFHPYGLINNQLYTQLTATGGAVAANTNGCEVNLSITTSVGSYSVLRANRNIQYRPGLVNTLTQSAVFNTGVANSLQFIGVGNNASDIYFCYNGATFGTRYSSGGLSEVRKLTINVAENTTATATITLNSVAYTVSLTNAGGSTNFTAHQVETGSSFGGIWNIEHIGNVVFFSAKSVGSLNGTYSYSSTGASTGTFTQLKAGVALTSNFTAQADWNGTSIMKDTLDPTKKNMYRIEYVWHGAGNITYSVYNPDNSTYEVVHTEVFANSATSPSLTQPNMFLQQGIASLGSTTAMTLKTSGMYAAVYGNTNVKAPINGITNSKAISANTETVLLCIKNRNTLNGFNNQSSMYLERITVSTDGNRPVIIKIIKNPTTLSANTTTDYTNYTYVDENNSLAIYDTTTDTYTGGTILDTIIVGKNLSEYLDYSGEKIEFFQSDIIIFTATSTAINTVDIAVVIRDDI